jgi:hypothetical protein
MSEYDELMRDLLVERYRPVTRRRTGEGDHLKELAQALSRETRQTPVPVRRNPSRSRAERSSR